MVSVDYTYYTTTYLGNSVSSADFPKLLNKANLEVDRSTFYRAGRITNDDANTSLVSAIKNCLCSVVDVISKFESSSNANGVVSSESVGSWSVSYDTKVYSASLSKKIANEVDLYLERYGLTCMII